MKTMEEKFKDLTVVFLAIATGFMVAALLSTTAKAADKKITFTLPLEAQRPAIWHGKTKYLHRFRPVILNPSLKCDAMITFRTSDPYKYDNRLFVSKARGRVNIPRSSTSIEYMEVSLSEEIYLLEVTWGTVKWPQKIFVGRSRDSDFNIGDKTPILTLDPPPECRMIPKWLR